MPLDADIAAALGRPDLPARLEQWRLVLSPGSTRPSDAAEWAGCIVLVERGSVQVDCHAGGMRSFEAGDLLTLGWLPLRSLRNPGGDEACLLAVRRRRLPAPARTPAGDQPRHPSQPEEHDPS